MAGRWKSGRNAIDTRYGLCQVTEGEGFEPPDRVNGQRVFKAGAVSRFIGLDKRYLDPRIKCATCCTTLPGGRPNPNLIEGASDRACRISHWSSSSSAASLDRSR